MPFVAHARRQSNYERACFGRTQAAPAPHTLCWHPMFVMTDCSQPFDAVLLVPPGRIRNACRRAE